MSTVKLPLVKGKNFSRKLTFIALLLKSKIKQTLFNKFFICAKNIAVLAAVFAVLGGFLLFGVSKAEPQMGVIRNDIIVPVASSTAVDLNSVQLQLDTYVNGKMNQPDNYIRVGLKDGIIRIASKITLISLKRCEDSFTCNNSTVSDYLTVNKDKIFYYGRSNDTIYGFASGIVGPADKPTACSEYEKWSNGLVSFMTCKFSNLGAQINPVVGSTHLIIKTSNTTSVPDEAVAYTANFNIPASSFSGLGITSPNQRYTLTLYEGILANFNSNQIIFPNGGKDIIIETYPTQAEATAADAQGRPADVVGYGSVTGSAQAKNESPGNSIAGLITKIIGTILGIFQEIIYTIFFWLVAPVIQAMLSIHVYTDTFAAVIYPGWEVVRNICNIFFIVAIIVIAMATLFRVEAYQFKQLLVDLIIAALLVNFSLVIAQVILGLADTMQAQFLPANVTVIRSLAGDLMVKTYREEFYGKNSAIGNGQFSSIVKPFFFLALSLGSFAVFCAIAVFLMIRIIALWLLLLISPIAYAVGVLPATAQYRSQWWQNFLKYAFFTPIMAFFLNMTAIISTASRQNPVLQTINDGSLVKDLGGDNLAGFVFKVASNILLLVFLIASLKVAEMAGIYGASGITSMAQKGIFAPFAGAKWLGGVGWRNLQRYKRDRTKDWVNETDNDGKKTPFYKKIAFAAFNPDAVYKAFHEDAKKNQERAEHEVEKAGLDIKRQTPFFKEKNLPSQLAEAQNHYVDELSKESPYSGIEALEVDILLNELKLAPSSDKARARSMAKALQVFEEKGGNTLMSRYKNADGSQKYKWSSKGINAWLNDLVKQGVWSRQMAGEMRSRISKIGYSTKQTELYEGVNSHGVHPTTFDTYDDDQEILGKTDYEAAQNFAITKIDKLLADSSSKEAKQLNISTTGLTKPEDVDYVTKKYRAELMEKMMVDFADENPETNSNNIYGKLYGKDLHKLNATDEKGKTAGFDHDRFHNYSKWEASMAQARVNVSKSKDATALIKDNHWNSVWDEYNGTVGLQYMEVAGTQDLKEDSRFAGGRGLPEKTMKGIIAVTRGNDIEAMLAYKNYLDFQVETYRRNGLDPAKFVTEIKQKAFEQTLKLKAIPEAATRGQVKGTEWLKAEVIRYINSGSGKINPKVLEEFK